MPTTKRSVTRQRDDYITLTRPGLQTANPIEGPNDRKGTTDDQIFWDGPKTATIERLGSIVAHHEDLILWN